MLQILFHVSIQVLLSLLRAFLVTVLTWFEALAHAVHHHSIACLARSLLDCFYFHVFHSKVGVLFLKHMQCTGVTKGIITTQH